MSIQLAKSLKLQNAKTWSVDYKKAHLIDCNLLAVASADHKIKVLDIRDVDNIRLNDVLDETVHKKTIRSVAWRPNCSSWTLAAASFDSTISIWNKEEPVVDYNDSDADDVYNQDEMELLAIIEGHENEVKGVSWSHDGMLLATCSRDKSVWIWETDEMGEEYECISVLQEHSQDVKHVAWNPFVNVLASSSYDDTIRLWKEFDDDWECVAILSGHKGTVWCSDFEIKEVEGGISRLCSSSDDGTVRVWKYIDDNDDEYGQQEWICQTILPKVHERTVYCVSWSENGLIASTGADGKLVIYKETDEEGTWEILAKHDLCHTVYEVNVVKWINLNGTDMLVTGGDDGYINLWSVNT
ncbi:hypothetical protein KAFR_0H00550 [Kazachstania africana CBS 2517]|uniref:Probable cytosolic iron-sulfur protein assembly protein 1 n=1 Tax=Kazachstania africana (strain ATCC 22294 / BCRC 22015 / CBS 2517 / CECT 1963 / NBRC 1671 / NRRL Y-8276) TaxID=1071382 RepID=H2AYQ8_KAZAF|nr:hypothetical protein KAFR_0H00550 [Kazachstania africana CBS 2517]CCF59464.1 hypothetical protein KAFR_0H00550 [Kazachstania africana CBS 2517]